MNDNWKEISFKDIKEGMIVKSSKWNLLGKIVSIDIPNLTVKAIYLNGEFEGLQDEFRNTYFDLLLIGQ